MAIMDGHMKATKHHHISTRPYYVRTGASLDVLLVYMCTSFEDTRTILPSNFKNLKCLYNP